MNKLFLIAAFGLAITMASCKKDYVCKCTKTYTGTSTTVTKDDGQYTYKDTKTTADTRCKANEKTDTDLGGTYTRNCSIQ